MAGIFNIIAKLFGNKYDKDIKQIRPIVDKIHLEHKKISQLSHDELRNQTKILKSKIHDFVSAENLTSRLAQTYLIRREDVYSFHLVVANPNVIEGKTIIRSHGEKLRTPVRLFVLCLCSFF